ncbi:hypothetical protein Tco_1426957 [Tanacetum coccineum]
MLLGVQRRVLTPPLENGNHVADSALAQIITCNSDARIGHGEVIMGLVNSFGRRIWKLAAKAIWKTLLKEIALVLVSSLLKLVHEAGV